MKEIEEDAKAFQEQKENDEDNIRMEAKPSKDGIAEIMIRKENLRESL